MASAPAASAARASASVVAQANQAMLRALISAMNLSGNIPMTRPIIFYRNGGTCRQPYIKGLTLMVNIVFNGWPMEDVWLDQQR
jgi:hypothetical protein